jgi:hypothetical protein
MPLADLIAYAKTVLLTVSGIGRVHTYQPTAVKPEDITDALKAGDFIHYWTISRVSTPETRAPSTHETQRDHVIMIRGRYEVKTPDEATSEPIFHALIDAAQETFRAIHSYEVAPNRFDMVGPLSCDLVGHQLLAETFLVHYAELRWPAMEIVDSRL